MSDRTTRARPRAFAALASALTVCNQACIGFSFAGLGLLFAGFLSPLPWLALGGVFTWGLLRLHRPTWPSGASASLLALVGIGLVVGLAIRYPTSSFVHGGRDQGTYVNAAAWYADQGAIPRHDPILSDAFEEGWFFNKTLVSIQYERQIPGAHEGERMLGFVITDRVAGTVMPQFYHLTPIWLAAGRWLFGASGTSTFLPLFGVLAALAGALLAHRLAGARAALFTLFALLTSGLEVFFSSFPVSEILSQFLLLTGVYLALITLEDGDASRGVVAGLSISAAFFNHVASVFYLVPLSLGVAAALLARPEAKVRTAALRFHLVVTLGALGSLVAGYVFNAFYVWRVFRPVTKIFGPGSVELTFGLLGLYVVLAGVAPWVAARLSWSPPFQRVRQAALALLAVVVAGVAIRYGLFLFGIGGAPERHYTYLSSMGSHVTVLGYAGMIAGAVVAVRRAERPARLLPVLCLLWFVFLVFGFWFFTHFQWYFNRYYVREIFPLGVVMISCGLAALWSHRKKALHSLAWVLAASFVLYGAHPVPRLMGQPSLQGALTHLDALDDRLEDDSVVLFVQSARYAKNNEPFKRLATPLHFAYGHDVIAHPDHPQLGSLVKEVAKKLGRYGRPLALVYISDAPLSPAARGDVLREVATQTHVWTDHERVRAIPRKVVTGKLPVRIYEVTAP